VIGIRSGAGRPPAGPPVVGASLGLTDGAIRICRHCARRWVFNILRGIIAKTYSPLIWSPPLDRDKYEAGGAEPLPGGPFSSQFSRIPGRHRVSQRVSDLTVTCECTHDPRIVLGELLQTWVVGQASVDHH